MSVYLTRPLGQFNSVSGTNPDMSEGHWARIHTPLPGTADRWVQWDMLCEGRQTPDKSRWSSYAPNHVCCGRLRKAKFFGNGVNQGAFAADSLLTYYEEDGPSGAAPQCDYKYLAIHLNTSDNMRWTADQDYSLVCLWMLTTNSAPVDVSVSTDGDGTIITPSLDTNSANGWGPRVFTTGGDSDVQWIPLVADVASGDTITFTPDASGWFYCRGILGLTDDYCDDPDETGYSPTVWSPRQIVNKGTLRADWADADAYDILSRGSSIGTGSMLHFEAGTTPNSDQWGCQQHSGNSGNGLCAVGDDTSAPSATWYGITKTGATLSSEAIEFGTGAGQIDAGDVTSYDTIVMQLHGEACMECDTSGGASDPVAWWVEKMEWSDSGLSWTQALTPNDHASTENLKWKSSPYAYWPMCSFVHDGNGVRLRALDSGNLYLDSSATSQGDEYLVPADDGVDNWGWADTNAFEFDVPGRDVRIVWHAGATGKIYETAWLIKSFPDYFKLYNKVDDWGAGTTATVGETIGSYSHIRVIKKPRKASVWASW